MTGNENGAQIASLNAVGMAAREEPVSTDDYSSSLESLLCDEDAWVEICAALGIVDYDYEPRDADVPPLPGAEEAEEEEIRLAHEEAEAEYLEDLYGPRYYY